ncbi:hypothetical protein KCV00_g29, partial [Aureobasidium melanogenum]
MPRFSRSIVFTSRDMTLGLLTYILHASRRNIVAEVCRVDAAGKETHNYCHVDDKSSGVIIRRVLWIEVRSVKIKSSDVDGAEDGT